jgi:hypothetical protein
MNLLSHCRPLTNRETPRLATEVPVMNRLSDARHEIRSSFPNNAPPPYGCPSNNKYTMDSGDNVMPTHAEGVSYSDGKQPVSLVRSLSIVAAVMHRQ